MEENTQEEYAEIELLPQGCLVSKGLEHFHSYRFHDHYIKDCITSPNHKKILVVYKIFVALMSLNSQSACGEIPHNNVENAYKVFINLNNAYIF